MVEREPLRYRTTKEPSGFIFTTLPPDGLRVGVRVRVYAGKAMRKRTVIGLITHKPQLFHHLRTGIGVGGWERVGVTAFSSHKLDAVFAFVSANLRLTP